MWNMQQLQTFDKMCALLEENNQPILGNKSRLHLILLANILLQYCIKWAVSSHDGNEKWGKVLMTQNKSILIYLFNIKYNSLIYFDVIS